MYFVFFYGTATFEICNKQNFASMHFPKENLFNSKGEVLAMLNLYE